MLSRRVKFDALQSAQAAYEQALRRATDIDAIKGLRGEQLRIIDPGIVPQRPSFPDLPLNCLAALLLATLGVVAWLSMQFGLDRRRALAARAQLRMTHAANR